MWLHEGPGGGALPYVGGYKMPVNRPIFYTDLSPNDPFFPQYTPNDPFFPLSYQILQTNCKFSRASSAFEKFSNFNIEFANLAWNCIFAH